MNPPDSQPNSSSTSKGISGFLSWARGVLDITDNAAPEETIAGIHRDIDFKGFNVWILILAIYIASIGLNVNSTAVIIGAMLISPLMGPIMGVGLSVGINDSSNLKRSLRSLAIAVAVSLATSALYFAITPLGEAQSELLARTRPNVLDVFIAFFGGLAGILAGSRKEKSNVIPGVAIATALMPPLCTAGYGLGTGQWTFFIGAFYLFLINATFISIATFLVVRYLRFPSVSASNERSEKRKTRWVGVFAFLMIAPAVWVFYTAVQESVRLRRVDRFISEVVEAHGSVVLRREELPLPKGERELKLALIGREVDAVVLATWQSELEKRGLEKLRIRLVQNGGDPSQLSALSGERVFAQYLQTKSENERLEQELESLRERQSQGNILPIAEELKALDPQILEVSFIRRLRASEGMMDTLESVEISWTGNVAAAERKKRNAALSRFLAKRIGKDSVMVE
jgi:uncharacterized hydrophobic protein (TIGR00271 family)